MIPNHLEAQEALANSRVDRDGEDDGDREADEGEARVSGDDLHGLPHVPTIFALAAQGDGHLAARHEA